MVGVTVGVGRGPPEKLTVPDVKLPKKTGESGFV